MNVQKHVNRSTIAIYIVSRNNYERDSNEITLKLIRDTPCVNMFLNDFYLARRNDICIRRNKC